MEYEESQWEPGRWKELEKVPGNQATAELALYGHVNYQFRVYAVNAIGPGPPSEPTERHKTAPAGKACSPLINIFCCDYLLIVQACKGFIFLLKCAERCHVESPALGRRTL